MAKETNAPALTLDYAEWNSADPQTKDHFVRLLREACSGLGFFYLINTPLTSKVESQESSLRDRVFDINKRFFDLPLEVRQSITIDNSRHFRGFSKFGDERTRGNIDHRDQIDYGPEVEPVPAELCEKYPFLNLLGPNQFMPDSALHGHRSVVLEYFETCRQLSVDLTSAIELALLNKVDGSLLRFLVGQGGKEGDIGRRPYARMKTIRYPTASRETVDGIARLKESTQGVGAHKDGMWITLLCTSQHGGLQVQSLTGEWLDVPPRPDAVIANFGQQIERVSQGVINAASHRVLTTSSSSAVPGDRLSVAYFASPALNAQIDPIPQESLSHEIIEAWKRAREERKRALGNEETISDVPKGDLWGAEDSAFGEQAWRGITRSHPNVVSRWKYTLPA